MAVQARTLEFYRQLGIAAEVIAGGFRLDRAHLRNRWREIATIPTGRKGLWSTCTLGFVPRHLPIILLDLENLVSPEESRDTAETATSRLRRKKEGSES